MTTTIPFVGFYESTFSDAVDSLYIDDCGDVIDNIPTGEYKAVSLKLVQLYCAGFVEMVGEIVGNNLDISFSRMSSPKFYNYETDTIHVSVSDQSLRTVYDYCISQPDFAEYVRQRLMPRSGFAPFYPNDIGIWGDLSDWDAAQCGILFDYLGETLDSVNDYRIDPYELVNRV
jgi:hypothetical protein